MKRTCIYAISQKIEHQDTFNFYFPAASGTHCHFFYYKKMTSIASYLQSVLQSFALLQLNLDFIAMKINILIPDVV